MTYAPDIDLAGIQPTIDVHWPKPHVALVVLGGEHDLDSAPLVERAAGEAFLTCTHLIIDISPVQFALKKGADAKNCRFNLVMGTAPGVERALEVCGVLPALDRVRTVEAALEEAAA
jgi:hypothetical protein